MPKKDLSAFTHVFRADISTVIRPRRVSKRARQPLSCQPCRSRKLKCDRKHPACGSCFGRGDESSCSYSPAGPGDTRGVLGLQGENGLPSGVVTAQRSAPPRHEVQSRLQKLEEMVNGLLSKGTATGLPLAGVPLERGSSIACAAKTASTDSSPADGSGGYSDRTGGHLSSNGSEMSFVGATHWAAILERSTISKGILKSQIPSLASTYFPTNLQISSQTLPLALSILSPSEASWPLYHRA